jgi:hypothetical protein
VCVFCNSPHEVITHFVGNEESMDDFDSYSEDFENEEAETDGLKELSPVLFKQVKR